MTEDPAAELKAMVYDLDYSKFCVLADIVRECQDSRDFIAGRGEWAPHAPMIAAERDAAVNLCVKAAEAIRRASGWSGAGYPGTAKVVLDDAAKTLRSAGIAEITAALDTEREDGKWP